MKLRVSDATKFCLPLSLFILMSCEKESKTSGEDLVRTEPKITRSQVDSIINSAVVLFKKGDMKGYTDLFTTDGVSLGPEGPPIAGRSNIFTAYDNMYKSGVTGIEIQSNNLFVDNNLLSVDGIWSMTNTKGVDVGHGKFLWLMAKENSKWKILRDIYNYDTYGASQTTEPAKK